MHTHTNTHTHARTHARTHAHTQTHTNTHTHTHTHTHTRTEAKYYLVKRGVAGAHSKSARGIRYTLALTFTCLSGVFG